MKKIREFSLKALMSGLLIIVPSYLAVLLMLKGVKSLGGLVRPLVIVHPPGWSHAAENGLALAMVLALSFAVGVAIRSPRGRAVRERIERSVLVRIPAYALVRDLTQQLAGQGRENVWTPVLAEMGGGLVVAFIIEACGDGRCTVFIPSVPSPFRGSVYILPRERLHPVNASFGQTFHVLSRWGSGAKNLVAAMESERKNPSLLSKRAL